METRNVIWTPAVRQKLINLEVQDLHQKKLSILFLNLY